MVTVQAAKTANGPRIAIVGVTGAVGQEFLTVRGAPRAAALDAHVRRPCLVGLLIHPARCAGAARAQLPLQQHQAPRQRQVRGSAVVVDRGLRAWQRELHACSCGSFPANTHAVGTRDAAAPPR